MATSSDHITLVKTFMSITSDYQETPENPTKTLLRKCYIPMQTSWKKILYATWLKLDIGSIRYVLLFVLSP